MLVANVRWLSRYRHRRCLVPEVAAVLLEAFAGGRGLFEGAELAGDRLRVLPVLFHLMWRRQLTAGPGGAAGHVDRRACGRGAVSGARRRRVGIGDRILVGACRASSSA